MTARTTARRRLLATAVALAAPRAAAACPVCFGQGDGPMAQGTNMGIAVMLAVLACMLAAFAAFFLRLARRIRLAGAHDAHADAVHGGTA